MRQELQCEGQIAKWGLRGWSRCFPIHTKFPLIKRSEMIDNKLRKYLNSKITFMQKQKCFWTKDIAWKQYGLLNSLHCLLMYGKIWRKISKHIQVQNQKLHTPQSLLLIWAIEGDLELLKLPFMLTEAWRVEDKPQS